MEKFGETVLSFTGAGPHNISWEGYGFHLFVPEGAVSEGVTVYVSVEAFLPVPSKFILPEDANLVSPIYKVSSSEVFHKNVSMQISHYGAINSCEKAKCFRFIRREFTHEDVPYTYEILDGNFSANSNLATISLRQFSLIGVVAKSTRHLRNYQYAGHAYHKYMYYPGQFTRLELVFLLSPNSEVFDKVRTVSITCIIMS